MGLEETLASLVSGDPSLAAFGIADAAPAEMWTPPAKGSGRMISPEARSQMGLSKQAADDMTPRQSSWSKSTTGGSLGKPLWQDMASAGANPKFLGDLMAATYGHNMIGDMPNFHDAFAQSTGPTRDSLDYMRPKQVFSGRAGGAAVRGADTTDFDPYWTSGEMRKRKEQRMNAQDDARFQDSRKLRMLNSLLKTMNIGGGDGSQTVTEDSEQMYNNAGHYEKMPIHSVRTTTADPNQHLALLSELLGRLG